MPVFEIGAALSAFSAIKQLGRTIYDAKVDADVKERAREILDKLGDAQDVLYALREELLHMQGENADLKRQLDDSAEWKAARDAYAMVKSSGGAVVLRHGTSPEMLACPVCANDRKLVPLQDQRDMSGTYRCPACKAIYPVNPAQEYVSPPLHYPRNTPF